MELKEYQKKVTDKMATYISALAEFKDKYEKALNLTLKWQWITISQEKGME